MKYNSQASNFLIKYTMNNSGKRYCIVPFCSSTSVKTPYKYFFPVPKTSVRKKWLISCRRNPDVTSATSYMSCCEDHFDMENDTCNLTKFKILKGKCKLILKKNVVPHKFHCWDDISPTKAGGRSLRLDPNRVNLQAFGGKVIDNLPGGENRETSNSDKSKSDYGKEPVVSLPSRPHKEILKSCSATKPLLAKNSESALHPKTLKRSLVCVADSPRKKRTTQVELDTTYTEKAEIPTHVGGIKYKQCESMDGDEEVSPKENIIHFAKSKSPFSCRGTDHMSSASTANPCQTEKELPFLQMLMFVIEKNPKLYLGLSPRSFNIVPILEKNVEGLLRRDIFICLKKLKTNLPFSILGNDFNLSPREVETIFKNTLPKLAAHLKHFVFWPNPEITKRLLPIPFRVHYHQVEAIIGCMEIQIDKYRNPTKQFITRSEYYKCNTIKYLVSITPNGFVNFISKGYAGRISDLHITVNSGFLDNLTKGKMVMADRGFKQLGVELCRVGSKLVRPPCVLEGNEMALNEDLRGSIRDHVEKAVERFREFNLLSPHSTVDHNLVPYLDNATVIAAALINLQEPSI